MASSKPDTKPTDAHVIPYSLYELAHIYIQKEEVNYFSLLLLLSLFLLSNNYLQSFPFMQNFLITWLCEINLASLYKHRVFIVKSTGSLKSTGT